MTEQQFREQVLIDALAQGYPRDLAERIAREVSGDAPPATATLRICQSYDAEELAADFLRNNTPARDVVEMLERVVGTARSLSIYGREQIRRELATRTFGGARHANARHLFLVHPKGGLPQ